MPQSNKFVDWKLAAIAFGIFGLIVYGTLYSFDFYANPNPAGPFAALLATYGAPASRGDLIANVVLYVPLGFFSMLALVKRPSAGQIFLAVLSGLAISASVELTQFYVRGRVSALSDVWANTAGMALGAAVGVILHGAPRFGIGRVDRRPFIFLLLTCWLGARLFPYIPAINLHKYWNAMRPLFAFSRPPMLDVYRHTAAWLAIALLLEALLEKGRGTWVFLVSVPAVLFARILMEDAILSPAEAAGGLIAITAWFTVLSRLQARAAVIAVMFAGAVIIRGLEPFQFGPATRQFSWTPFLSFIGGSTIVVSFFEKAFYYGSLTWLSVRAGCSLRTAALAGGLLVFCLGRAQVYLPGRSAEITDTLLLLLLAATMRLLSEHPRATVQM